RQHDPALPAQRPAGGARVDAPIAQDQAALCVVQQCAGQSPAMVAGQATVAGNARVTAQQPLRGINPDQNCLPQRVEWIAESPAFDCHWSFLETLILPCPACRTRTESLACLLASLPNPNDPNKPQNPALRATLPSSVPAWPVSPAPARCSKRATRSP